jgi:hypothetical protein
MLSLSLALALSALGAREGNRQPIVAVFEIADDTGRSKKLVAGLTDYLRVKLAESAELKVVDKGEQEAELKKLIRAEKWKSYRACVDESCQIPIGKELAADKILRGKLNRFGKSFVLAVEMIDLASGASIGGASDKSDGTEESLLASVERVASLVMKQYQDAEARAHAAVERASAETQPPPPAAPAPTPAPLVAASTPPDRGPSGVAITLIVVGWSVCGGAYLTEIIGNLVASDISRAYYSLLPVGGPILANALRPNSNGLDYVDAGAQAFGAGLAVVGHVLAASGSSDHASQPALGPSIAGIEMHLGPRSLVFATRF